MKEYIEIICTVSLFSAITAFFSGKNEKYLRLAVSLVITLIMLSPLADFVNSVKDFGINTENYNNIYSEKSDEFSSAWLIKATLAEVSASVESSLLRELDVRAKVEFNYSYENEALLLNCAVIYTDSENSHIAEYIKENYRLDCKIIKESKE